MSHAIHDKTLPRPALLAMAGIVALSVLLAGAARLTGIGKTENPVSEPVIQAALVFEDRADGAVVVRHEGTRELVEVYDPGTNGFVRGVLRGMARERMLRGVGAQPPFILTRWADGRHTLSDPATGRSIELDPFGPTNSGVFVRLMLSASERAPSATPDPAPGPEPSSDAVVAVSTHP